MRVQSLRRIDSRRATSDLKLTDRTEGVFEPKEKIINNTAIPQHQIEATACCILPDIIAFYESKEGQREFAQWKKQQKATKLKFKVE